MNSLFDEFVDFAETQGEGWLRITYQAARDGKPYNATVYLAGEDIVSIELIQPEIVRRYWHREN